MLAVVMCFVMVRLSQSEDCIAKTADGSSCASDMKGAVKGSAMLQVRRLSQARGWQDPLVNDAVMTTTDPSCSIERAEQVPLTEDGFAQVSKSCCYEDMKVLMGRVIYDRGLKVCDEGGLSGMAPFYSCPPSPPTLAELGAELFKALPTDNSKRSPCRHWLAKRDESCAAPGLECAVSVVKPPPYPEPVALGYMAFKVANPGEMMRSSSVSRAIDVVRNGVALAIGLEARYVNVVIGSGPGDGEEDTSTPFQVPASQTFYALRSEINLYKVFIAFSIQDSKPEDRYIATPVSTLDEAVVVNGLKQLDTSALGTQLSIDLASLNVLIGSVELLEEAVCEKTSGQCTHIVIKQA